MEGARAAGAGDARVILRHILPNALGPIIVAVTLGIPGAIMSEASLSYLGLGVQPPTATWGSMIYEGRSYLRHAPWMSLAPGVMIMLTVLAFNLLGDGLRDALDPRTKKIASREEAGCGALSLCNAFAAGDHQGTRPGPEGLVGDGTWTAPEQEAAPFDWAVASWNGAGALIEVSLRARVGRRLVPLVQLRPLVLDRPPGLRRRPGASAVRPAGDRHAAARPPRPSAYQFRVKLQGRGAAPALARRRAEG